ncbi:sel1 repeat family protein [Alphaproteobacteria bacterium KMM 3653]|uniref:Sel1 repeat family protein n=1 Tax=Harenicola maris TaxID=2841044 RepID=A0AAP2G764_9RHOB|nr:sel1 repeat family protein [Harenicola maris]
MSRFLRSAALAAVIATVLPFSAMAQDADPEVAEARLDYIAGRYATALEVLTPAAEAGNANAQNLLGAAYENGNGVEQNIETAIAWYEKSAAQDFPRALHNLGIIYADGEHGITPDPEKARGLFEKALQQDYSRSYSNLGILYEQGRGVPRDLAKAAELYRQGDAGGDRNSTYNLANFMRQGIEMEENLEGARALYAKAADLGHAESFNSLALMFEYGMGGPVDNTAAYMFFREAVERGVALAGVNLGQFVTDQEGFWQDPVEGYGYCLWGIQNAAADQREGFLVECEGLVEYLTPEDETAAQLFAEQINP